MLGARLFKCHFGTLASTLWHPTNAIATEQPLDCGASMHLQAAPTAGSTLVNYGAQTDAESVRYEQMS